MATLNLFQIVSKQLKETTTVSLEDTHKQLDMVRGGASALPSWVYSAETVVRWSKARMNPPGWWFSSSAGSESPAGWGLWLGPSSGVSDSVGLR